MPNKPYQKEVFESLILVDPSDETKFINMHIEGSEVKFVPSAALNLNIGDSIAGPYSINTSAANTTEILTLANTAGSISVFRVDADPEGSITASPGDLAVGIDAGGEGNVWIKHTGTATNTGWKLYPITHRGDMHLHNNTTATVINDKDTPHLVQDLFSEITTATLDGFTFKTGQTAAITAFADATGGQVLVTSTNTLAEGDIVSISGTTSYNGIFAATNVSGTDFEITKAWVADDATGSFYAGDSYTVDVGSAGTYSIAFHGHGSSAQANKIFEFEVFKNTTAQENIESERNFSSGDIGSFSGAGLADLVAGDIITFGVIGLTDATNFTFKHLNLKITAS